MNASLIIILTAAGLAAPGLFAAEPDANADAKPTPERYQLKNRSVCNLDPAARAPFWPIGWVHREGQHPDVPMGPKYILDEKNFAVTSILMGPPAIAFINGRAYEEGQFLRQPRPGAPAAAGTAVPVAPVASANQPRIRVQRITDGQVWLAFETQIVAIPLKRPELNERKGTPELLNEEMDDAAPAPAPAPSVSKR